MPTFSIAHLDYIEGRYELPDLAARASRTSAPLQHRRLFRIDRIGQIIQPKISRAAQGWQPSVDVLIGLHAYKIPLAFLISHDHSGTAIHLGVWADPRRGQVTATQLDVWSGVLKGLLAGVYPTLEVSSAGSDLPGLGANGALALGIPSSGAEAIPELDLPVDRLIRAWQPFSGNGSQEEAWSALILAEPVDDDVIATLRADVLSEGLEIATAMLSARAPVPVYGQYAELLELQQKRVSQGLSDGAWRTAVYLLGDGSNLARLASSWRSVFQGPRSEPQPIRLVHDTRAAELAHEWSMPDIGGVIGPGSFQHPFAWQTLLNSGELSSYIHLPTRETEGLAVRPITFFNVVQRKKADQKSIVLGKICELRRRTYKDYAIPLDDLKRHALVVGMTGSGKTNTVKNLLSQIDARKVPFLVIEPAKKEYRELLNHGPLSKRLRVWTPGNERVAPIRLNPFEFEAGTPVGVHIDLLRSLFTASFGLWTPLPQILEQCLYEIYRNKGWVIATSKNPSLAEDENAPAFPTLTDLIAMVEEVTAGLGYQGEFTSTARAALTTRLNSLRTGAKGLMLNVPRGIPFDVFLKNPSVIELEDVGDDDDKAFLTGLFLLRLAEYRRSEGPKDHLEHVMVVEEAHRLFSRVSGAGGETEAQPRAKAVETFVSMLAEIRAYGQGVLIAEQSPIKLAPDVIKNTSLKICHRLIDQVDRMTAAGAMAMDEAQVRSLTSLRRNHGEVIVFGEGDEAPLSASIDLFETDGTKDDLPQRVHENWANGISGDGLEGAYHEFPTCKQLCQPINPLCAQQRHAADDGRLFSVLERLFLVAAVTDETAAIDEVLRHALTEVTRHLALSAGVQPSDKQKLKCALIHAAHQLVANHAHFADWPMATQKQVQGVVAKAIVVATVLGDSAAAVPDLVQAGQLMRQASRGPGPYAQCTQICGDYCQFRFAVEHSRRPAQLMDKLHQAIAEISEDPDKASDLLRDAVDAAGREFVMTHDLEASHWRAGFCALLHAIDDLAEFRWDEKSEIADAFLELCPLVEMEDT